MRKIIIYFIRKRLGLRKYQHFRFVDQKHTEDCYWFTSENLMKRVGTGLVKESSVSLNWLLSPDCRVVKVDDETKEGRV